MDKTGWSRLIGSHRRLILTYAKFRRQIEGLLKLMEKLERILMDCSEDIRELVKREDQKLREALEKIMDELEDFLRHFRMHKLSAKHHGETVRAFEKGLTERVELEEEHVENKELDLTEPEQEIEEFNLHAQMYHRHKELVELVHQFAREILEVKEKIQHFHQNLEQHAVFHIEKTKTVNKRLLLVLEQTKIEFEKTREIFLENLRKVQEQAKHLRSELEQTRNELSETLQGRKQREALVIVQPEPKPEKKVMPREMHFNISPKPSPYPRSYKEKD